MHSPSKPHFPVTGSLGGTQGHGAVLTKTRVVVADSDVKPARLAAKTESAGNVSLDSIQLELQRILMSAADERDAQAAFVELACQLTNGVWCGQFQQTSAGQLRCIAQHNPIADQNLAIAHSSVLPHADATVRTKKSVIAHDGDLTVVATPIFGTTQPENASQQQIVMGCLCVALNLKQAAAEPFLLIAQVVASAISQWQQQTKQGHETWQVDSTAAIAELMSKVVSTPGTRRASLVAANELASFLNASMIAIAFTRGINGRTTRVQAISGRSQFDATGKQGALVQAALNETLVRETVTTLPEIENDDRSIKLAHRRLAEAWPDCRLISSPLVTTSGQTIGAFVCALPVGQSDHERVHRFVSATSQHLADSLNVAKHASQGPVARLKQQTSAFCRGKAGRLTAVALTAVTLVMLIPISHRVSCHCGVQPMVRRFAVAPHDGILLHSLVKPGDVVAAGQVLAKMDDRELQLQRSELLAERETAMKKQDVSRTARDASATQIAALEIDQLTARLDLIQHKIDHLEITSAVDGVVLQGDWEDAQGAPVRTGDVLVEVAPLKKLKIELAVPEADVAHVAGGQPVTFVLDGDPFATHAGTIESIHPVSDVRENANVFVSEFSIDNPRNQLRPGMKGRAKIAAGTKPLGWILFHHPAERVYSIFR